MLSVFYIIYRTFEPLWGVLRVATEKLANAHMQVVQRFQDLLKELKEYGDKQKERHKQVSKFMVLMILHGEEQLFRVLIGL